MKDKIRILIFALTVNTGYVSGQSYTLQKVSDLHIDSFANAIIRDYDPKSDTYLGFIDKGSEGVELAIFDLKGKILVSKKRQGEGPEDYLMSALTMGFSLDGNIWIQTPMELLKYDLEFNLIEKIRFEPEKTIVVYTGPWSKFVPLTKSSQVSFIMTPSNININASLEWVPSKVNMVEYYDATSKSIQSEVVLSSRKVYQGIENEEFPAVASPVFTLDERSGDLYFTTSIDNEITVFNPINWNIIQRIPIKHEFFKALNDIPLRESNLAFSDRTPLFSRNVKVLKFDSDLVGLVYVKEISEAANDLKKSEGKPYRFIDPNYYRLILFKDGVQLPGEHTVSSGFIEMALPENRFLVKVSLGDEEPDYIPYEIWEIVEK